MLRYVRVEVPTDYLDYFTVEVPEGMQGRLWWFDLCYDCRILNVPPYLALDEQQILVPSSVLDVEDIHAPILGTDDYAYETVSGLIQAEPPLTFEDQPAVTVYGKFFEDDKDLYVGVVKDESLPESYDITLLVTNGKNATAATSGGPLRLTLYDPQEKIVGEKILDLAVDVVQDVVFTTPSYGVHRLHMEDNINVGGSHSGYAVDWWTHGNKVSFYSTKEDPEQINGNWSGYFYVPRCAKTLDGYEISTYPTGAIKYWDGSAWITQLAHAAANGDFSVSVPEGHDGEIWKMETCNSGCYFYNVPSLFARSPGDLLLPADIVEQDSGDPSCE